MTDPVTASQLITILTPVYAMQAAGVIFALKQWQATAKLREDFTVVATVVKTCKHCPKVN